MADIKNDFGTGLISHWELEEASGTRIDSHGSNDLTDNNTVGSATGIQGDGADFEENNDEYLSITDASQTGLDLSGDFSVSAWINLEKLPSTATKQSMGIVSKSNSGTNNVAYHINFNDFDNDLEINISGDGTFSNRNSMRTASPFVTSGELGNWIHVLVTYDVSAENITLYKNGTDTGDSTSISGTGVTTIKNSSVPFVIGRGNQNDTTAYFDGVIDEVTIWSRELSASEVTDIYNSGDGIPYEEGGGGVAVNNSARRLHMMSM